MNQPAHWSGEHSSQAFPSTKPAWPAHCPRGKPRSQHRGSRALAHSLGKDLAPSATAIHSPGRRTHTVLAVRLTAPTVLL